MNIEQMYKNAYARCLREAEEGIVPSALSGMRVEAEQEMLAKRLGLTNEESRARLREYVASKDMSMDDFKRLPMRDRFDLVREAFSERTA